MSVATSTLLVDIGNSRIKWITASGSSSTAMQAAAWTSAELPALLDRIWGDLPVPEAVAVSNVAGADVAQLLDRWAQRQWSLTPRHAAVTPTACGMTIAAYDVRRLGVDRWLAAIAAWRRHGRAACIVDCGTAITIDAVSRHG